MEALHGEDKVVGFAPCFDQAAKAVVERRERSTLFAGQAAGLQRFLGPIEAAQGRGLLGDVVPDSGKLPLLSFDVQGQALLCGTEDSGGSSLQAGDKVVMWVSPPLEIGILYYATAQHGMHRLCKALPPYIPIDESRGLTAAVIKSFSRSSTADCRAGWSNRLGIGGKAR